jgi:hypothetical protein
MKDLYQAGRSPVTNFSKQMQGAKKLKKKFKHGNADLSLGV